MTLYHSRINMMFIFVFLKFSNIKQQHKASWTTRPLRKRKGFVGYITNISNAEQSIVKLLTPPRHISGELFVSGIISHHCRLWSWLHSWGSKRATKRRKGTRPPRTNEPGRVDDQLRVRSDANKDSFNTERTACVTSAGPLTLLTSERIDNGLAWELRPDVRPRD